MTLIGVIGVLVVTLLRPEKDNMILVGAILAFVGPMTTGILSFMKSQETNLSVNSRMEEMIEQAKSIGFHEGVTSERDVGHTREDRGHTREDRDAAGRQCLVTSVEAARRVEERERERARGEATGGVKNDG
jgi:hypothetical protein